MLVLSTGAKTLILQSGWKTGFAECAILLFSGSPPTNPDSGINVSNSLVAIAAVDPTNWAAGAGATYGIEWDDAAAGAIVKKTGEVVIAKGVAAGDARFFWIVPNVTGSAATGASTTIARVQGLAGIGAGDMVLSSVTFAVNSTSTCDVGRIYF